MSFRDPLPPARLRPETDPATLPFASTAELEALPDIIAQERAVEAVRFGIGMRRQGYNLYVLGPPGLGKHRVVLHFLDGRAAQEPPPPDWCYIHNFAEPHKPHALRLPTGRGLPLKADVDRLIEELRAALPAAFEGDEYRGRRQAIDDEFKRRQEGAFETVQRAAQQRGIALIRTPMGFAFAPLKGNEVMTPEVFQQLPEPEQAAIRNATQELEAMLQDTLVQIPRWEREHRQKVRDLIRDVARLAVGHLIGELRKKYGELPGVLRHLDAIEADVVDNVEPFLRAAAGVQAGPPVGAGPGGEAMPGGEPPSFRRYQINALVDSSACTGAPVIYENHPTHPNLIGRVEHIAQFGTLVTDFNLIKAGAIHRANGGYLVLDAEKLLVQPFAWEELKRTLRMGQARIESLGQMLSVVSTVSLEPEPIPLDIKVVLIGDRLLYHLLSAYDPDFADLFKVAADFDERTDRSAENNRLYARLVAGICERETLRPLSRAAVARVLDHAVRLAGDAEKLTAHMLSLADVLREADYWAAQDGAAQVDAVHVKKAIDMQTRRLGRVRDRVQEAIRHGTVLIDTAGARVGQVNGLSVSQVGSSAFGQPSRITARVRLGRGGIVDIERAAKLGGPIHTKGVLILQGFLGQHYARDVPLTLSASLVLEQSYGGVEGDSASLAELCALLSALAEVPIRQSFAMTGSVNQHGQAQAIGGANEKIEGFFDVCRAAGLTGEQGVIIPTANVRHLMLRDDIVEAAAAGRFHVHAVDTVEQAIELLTGMPAGARDADGNFPEGSVNQRVEARLTAFARAAQSFGAAAAPRPESGE